jgi:hypothetical protein
MSRVPGYDVSVILPFSDHEDVIGAAVKRVAAHLREQELDFEILAIDEDSGDNAHAVLCLVRKDVPELRVVHAHGRARGFACGVARAQGRVLWLIDAESAAATLAPFGRAFRRVARGERDVVVVKNRFVICHRTRSLAALDGLRATPVSLARRVARRAQSRGLALEVQAIAGPAGDRNRISPRHGRRRSWSGIFGALAAARSDRQR